MKPIFRLIRIAILCFLLVGALYFTRYKKDVLEDFFASVVQDPIGIVLMDWFFRPYEVLFLDQTGFQKANPLDVTTPGTGTGFFINDRYIVTNAHVVNACKGKNKLRTVGLLGRSEARIIAISKDIDLAIIENARRSQVHGILQEKHQLRRNDYVSIVGYPLGTYAYASLPVKKSYKRIYTDWGTAHHSIGLDEKRIRGKIGPGNSGSPAMDNYGNIIGVMHAGSNKEGYMLFPISLRLFLDYHDIDYTVQKLTRKLNQRELERYGASFVVEVYCLF